MESKSEEASQQPLYQANESSKSGKPSKFFIDDSEFEKPFNRVYDDFDEAMAEAKNRIRQGRDMPRHPLSEEAVARVKTLPENEACKLIEAECVACSHDLHKKMAHNHFWIGSIYQIITKPYPWMRKDDGNAGKKEEA